MKFDFEGLTAYQRYKLMAVLIAPRPIALITTLNANGVVNAAPFSLFNMAGEDPPIVMVSINRRDDDSLKDTARNIARDREFVLHICDDTIGEQMHACGMHLPEDESEVDRVGFTTVPSERVSPPRIAEAPVAFECTLFESLETRSRQIFIGEVQCLHVRDGLVDPATFRVALEKFHPIGRMGGTLYTHTRSRFELGGATRAAGHAEIKDQPGAEQ
jgi:flavin reductase (DIM6/NTAB) family NADH-FMN oxidoreductase RutF